MKPLQPLALSLCILALSGCGGGDHSAAAGTDRGTETVADDTDATDDGDSGRARIASATAESDASTDATDAAAGSSNKLLKKAVAEAARQQKRQAAVMKSIYGKGTDVTDLSLNIGKSSISIGTQASTLSVPYIVSDGGAGIAAVTTLGTGRGLAYGADVLQWMGGTTNQPQHLPLFTRAFTWLLTGQGGGTLPTTIRYATAGYTASSVSTFITRLGKGAEAVACAIADPANTCWQNADLLVFGGSTPANDGLAALVRRYLAAGKPVLYLHPGWWDSAGGRQVVTGLGMTMGGYPGNYYASTANVSVGSTRTIAESLAKADRLSSLVASLRLLQQDAPAVDLSTDTSPVTPYTTMLAELGRLQEAGVELFGDDTRLRLQQLLVRWADTRRPSLAYGSVSRKDAAAFLRTYATDAFMWTARQGGTAATAGQGDYMPAAAQALVPSTRWETLEITLPQASGVTLIGRGALPGKAAQVEVLDATNAGTLSLRTSFLRSWGNPLTDSGDKYPRPLRPHSFLVPLGSGVHALNSPNGGPLMLSYSGATAGAVVKLRVKGVTRYAHFDYVQGMSEAEVAEASAALKAGTYGWQTTKVVGGEIQQTIRYAQSVVGSSSPEYYANTLIRDGLFKSNHLANGYNDAGQTENVASLCASLGWTCDGSVHNAPSVQHFVGWIATCGFLCSGNPIDGYAGIGLGWGYAHELGHNTVQRVMHITPNGSNGCVVECDNNILAGATAMRVWETLGLEISSGHPVNHPALYGNIVANRATGLSGDALVSDMTTRLWTDGLYDSMRGVHFQLAFLFAKERCGQDRPSMSCAMDYFSLLTKGDRLVAKTFTVATAAKYGMGRYTSNSISNHDLLYVLSSRLIGQDLRQVFGMYGIPLSETALGSVADLGLPLAPRRFYALAAGKHNQLSTGQWLDLESGTPAWPY